jgi:glutamate-5-semialdehyde dehydrogenase
MGRDGQDGIGPAPRLVDEITEMGRRARAASHALALISTAQKNEILLAMAQGLLDAEGPILAANALDLAAAEENGVNAAMADRLKLDSKRLNAMAVGLRQVATLADPVGERLAAWDRPNGLQIEKKRVPIGTIGIIFESRPNVTSDAAGLCFKSGNATILRGGKESFHSNLAIAAALQAGGIKAGMPEHAVQLISTTDRDAVGHLCRLDQYLDLIIPRGGRSLIEAVVSQARMPVIKHYDGVCHVFVDAAADLQMASDIIVNAKTQKPSVCNAAETLLIHRAVVAEFAPRVARALQDQGVALRGDEAFLRAVAGVPGLRAIQPAVEADWSTEYLDLILSIKVVDSLAEAIDHIHAYGSKHSDCIVTETPTTAETFLASVDSACCFWNASTRFNDGEEFGFGAEIGISTDKLHARGPMALAELTSYKYLIRGQGQTRG